MKKHIYLDYAATTPVDPAVFDAMLPYLSTITNNPSTGLFGNPGSLHSYGQQASGAVFIARQMIAKELNCHYSEVVFTGSATEANNLALRGALKAYGLQLTADGQKKGRSRIIISAIEHESVLATAKDLEKDGVEVVVIPVSKDGVVDLKKLKAALNERTVLVSVMYANNEIGTIQPITEIAKIIRDFRASSAIGNKPLAIRYPLLHTDAVQAFQYLECDVQELGVDLLTLSAHKIYGPKGIGALCVRSQPVSKLSTTNYPLSTILTGGGQESGLRSGTENVPCIVGFAKAVGLAVMDREDEAVRVTKLRDQAWVCIKKLFPKAVLNGSIHGRLPNNLNFHLPGVLGEQLLVALDMQGVAVSSGSACTARSTNPSHVVLALGYDEKRAKNSVRISLGRMTTKKEITDFLKEFKKAKEMLV
jgi:cysteine desulfurase